MESQYKAIIFDYDGVITDTESFRATVLNELIEPYGKRIPQGDDSIVGKKTHHYLKETFPDLTEEQTTTIRKLWRQKRLERPTPLVPGVKDVITYAQSNAKTAITTGSSKEAVAQTLEHHAIKAFDALVTGEDFDTSKPDPECYRLALERLGLEPGRALVIEDSAAGIRAGKAAGCTVYGLGTYHDEQSLLKAGADQYFRDHHSLLEGLKKAI